MDIARLRSEGKLPDCCWPGCYPLVYLTQDGGVLCPDCANGQNGSDAHEDADDPQWRIVGYDVLWENKDGLCCDHCYCVLEAAYGDDP